MRTQLKMAVPAIIVVWISSVILLWPAHGAVFGWDEVDYINAAKLGISVNALERNSLSPLAYYDFARAKSSGKPPNLPSNYDENLDTLLLRHYHPPLVVLILSLIPNLDSERAARSVQILGALILTLAIFSSYFSVSSSPSWFGVMIISLYALWVNISMFKTISFHGWAAIWITTSAGTLYLWRNNPRYITGLALCVSLALGLLTLETGIFVFGVVLGIVFGRLALQSGLFTGRESQRISWRQLIAGIFIVGLIVFAVWPGSIVKVSILKIPALYAYRIIQGQEYARVSGMSGQLIESLSPMIPAIIGCIWVLIKDRERRSRLAPVVMIGLLYALLLTPFALSPGYLLPGFAPLICFIGVSVDRIRLKSGRLALAGLALGLILATGVWRRANANDEMSREDLKWLAENLTNRQALVDGGHIYQHYLGRRYDIRTISLSYDAKSLLLRERGEYRELRKEEISDKLVVIQKRPQQSVDELDAGLLAECSKIDCNNIIVWDCSNSRFVQKADRR